MLFAFSGAEYRYSLDGMVLTTSLGSLQQMWQVSCGWDHTGITLTSPANMKAAQVSLWRRQPAHRLGWLLSPQVARLRRATE